MASCFREKKARKKAGGIKREGMARSGSRRNRGDIAGNNDNRDDNRIIVGSDGQCVILHLEESGSNVGSRLTDELKRRSGKRRGSGR